VLLQFNRASICSTAKAWPANNRPGWRTGWISGKPAQLLETQRAAAFKNELPRVIRPDIILTESGPCITELDSVPGGIGVTAWLNQTYAAMPAARRRSSAAPDGMLQGFAGIFGERAGGPHRHFRGSATYRPEMEWLAGQLGERFQIRDARFTDFKDGDAVYRFFELFDLPNVPNAGTIIDMALAKRKFASPRRPSRFSRKKCSSRCCGTGTCAASGGRNWASAF
jgi:hypothetical protein